MIGSATRQFIGISRLYREREKIVPRTFLQRNLDQALRAHETRLNPNVIPHQNMVANEKRSAGWDYPTLGMLEDLTNGSRPVLQIDRVTIQPIGSQETASDASSQVPNDPSMPEWLPNRGYDFRAPCHVTVEVQNGHEIVFRRSKQALLVGRIRKGNDLYLEITLEPPFLIELDELFIVVDRGTNGFRRWKRTTFSNHTLNFVVHMIEPQALSDLQARIGKHHFSGPSFKHLAVAWDKLPDCPNKHQRIPLVSNSANTWTQTHDVDISMGWNQCRGSVLENYNQAHVKTSDSHHQLPTPSASDMVEPAHKPAAIRYFFTDNFTTRAHTKYDLTCIWCAWRREFHNLTQLMFHYLTYHDHFNFELEEREQVDDPGVVVIMLELAKRGANYYDYQSKPEEQSEWEWTAPERPFDVEAFVNGDNSWVGGKKPTKRSKSAKVKGPEPEGPTTRVAVKRRASLMDVQNIEPLKRRKVTVPDVPGVRFYHSTSKQPLEAGAEFSYSEDDLPDARLAGCRRESLRALGLSDDTLTFHEAFNSHLDNEQCISKTLIEDAIVRFARSFKVGLLDKRWSQEFTAKIKHLQLRKMISPDVLRHCLDLIGSGTGQGADKPSILSELERTATANENSSQPSTLATQSWPERSKPPERLKDNASLEARNLERNGVSPSSLGPTYSDKRNEGQKSSPAKRSADVGYKDSTRGNEKANGPPNGSRIENGVHEAAAGVCVCGEAAVGARRALACDSLDCTRVGFHLACVGLERIVPGWTCRDCSQTGS